MERQRVHTETVGSLDPGHQFLRPWDLADHGHGLTRHSQFSDPGTGIQTCLNRQYKQCNTGPITALIHWAHSIRVPGEQVPGNWVILRAYGAAASRRPRDLGYIVLWVPGPCHIEPMSGKAARPYRYGRIRGLRTPVPRNMELGGPWTWTSFADAEAGTQTCLTDGRNSVYIGLITGRIHWVHQIRVLGN